MENKYNFNYSFHALQQFANRTLCDPLFVQSSANYELNKAVEIDKDEFAAIFPNSTDIKINSRYFKTDKLFFVVRENLVITVKSESDKLICSQLQYYSKQKGRNKTKKERRTWIAI